MFVLAVAASNLARNTRLHNINLPDLLTRHPVLNFKKRFNISFQDRTAQRLQCCNGMTCVHAWGMDYCEYNWIVIKIGPTDLCSLALKKLFKGR